MNIKSLGVLTAIVVCIAADSEAGSSRPTFTKDIAPIFYENCITCHRPGEIAPMSLRTYEEVRPWVKSIQRYVNQGEMPPWHATSEFGTFSNDRSLEQSEIDTIVRWAKRGAPEGDPALLPPLPTVGDSEWRLGDPDLIVEFERVNIPGDGPDVFHDLSAAIDIPEDTWLTAMEVLPGNRSVVHHVIVFQRDEKGGANSQGWLGAWAAGTDPMIFPEGTGRLLRKGARLIADMHYHPSDKDASDVTRIGLHFAKNEEIEKELTNLWVMNASFSIPPGAKNHEVVSSHTFEQDSHIHNLLPHMHYRGKDFTYTATFPDGRKEVLLKVEDYDFNWQTVYELAQPLAAPKGTRIDCVAHFDNSADNPDNPDPTKRVTFGDESYDEMMIGFLDFTVDEGIRPEPPQVKIARALEALAAEHPGEVYRIHSRDDEPDEISALHLPREGDGIFHVTVNGSAKACPVTRIEWNGSAYKCRVTVPGVMTVLLDGEIDAATNRLTGTLRLMNGDEFSLQGTPLS